MNYTWTETKINHENDNEGDEEDYWVRSTHHPEFSLTNNEPLNKNVDNYSELYFNQFYGQYIVMLFIVYELN